MNAERYDRARPRYPDALIQRVIAASPGVEFLDVGCGTGIGARQYRAAGCTVLGVEPDPRMAEFAKRTGVEIEIGKFENWDPSGRSFDAVVAGQAWHWVDPVLGARKAAQVLRPHGLLAMYWHVFDPPSEVANAFDDVLQRAAPDAPLQNRPSDGSQPGNLGIEFNREISRGLRKVSELPAASANPSSGGLNGSGTIRATNGWTICPPLARLPSSRRTSSQLCWKPWEPPSTRSEVASPWSTSPWQPPRPGPATLKPASAPSRCLPRQSCRPSRKTL